MSAPNPNSNCYTLAFTFGLCTLCAVLLAAMASALKPAQEAAIAFDIRKQMLFCARLLDEEEYFLTQESAGGWGRATLNEQLHLVADPEAPPATYEQINALFQAKIHPMFTNAQGTLASPQEQKIDLKSYLAQHQKPGFAHLEHKLLYLISSSQASDPKKAIEGYIIPVNGFGVWGPLYGYLALARDGQTVLGICWYQHSETPGLGANISDPDWQAQFYNKLIFQSHGDGQIDYERAPVGLCVVKGKVSYLYSPEDPRVRNSVDGMTGATITGNGVTSAYKSVLEEYRPLLVQAAKSFSASKGSP